MLVGVCCLLRLGLLASCALVVGLVVLFFAAVPCLLCDNCCALSDVCCSVSSLVLLVCCCCVMFGVGVVVCCCCLLLCDVVVIGCCCLLLRVVAVGVGLSWVRLFAVVCNCLLASCVGVVYLLLCVDGCRLLCVMSLSMIGFVAVCGC